MSLFRTDRSGAAVAVGPLEAAVMEVLWAKGGSVPVPDVHGALADSGRKLSYSAVKAVLNNLADKGFLEKARDGKVTRFEALQSREQFDAAVVGKVIAGLKRNFGAPAIAQLVGELAIDEESLDELERLIARRRAELKP